MKQFLTVLLVAMAILSVVPASSSAQITKLQKGDKIVSAGVGFGMPGFYGGASLPPISVNFEYGLEPKIGIGGIVAYSGSSEDWGWGSVSYKYIVIAARGQYHFWDDGKNLDAYGGAELGYTIVSSSANTKVKDDPLFRAWSAGGGYMMFGIFVGGKYHFSQRWAGYLELGYAIGFINAGISYKL
jgi:hypothetical protein